jgi:hypothetical protein
MDASAAVGGPGGPTLSCQPSGPSSGLPALPQKQCFLSGACCLCGRPGRADAFLSVLRRPVGPSGPPTKAMFCLRRLLFFGRPGFQQSKTGQGPTLSCRPSGVLSGLPALPQKTNKGFPYIQALAVCGRPGRADAFLPALRPFVGPSAPPTKERTRTFPTSGLAFARSRPGQHCPILPA